jgi:multidrug efflux pump subunit AcrA (membrane-fusion protein)
MKPIQIGKNKLISRIIWIVVIVAVLGGGGYYAVTRFTKKTTTKSTATTLYTTTVKQGDLTIYASGTGNLVAAQEASLGFGTEGTVSAVNFKLGDNVKKGDVIAQLKSDTAQTTYENARRTLMNLQSTSSIATAEQAVATAESDATDAMNTLIYDISPQVYYAEQNIAAAEKALEEAQKVETETPSDANKKAVDTATAALEKAQKSLKSAQYYYKNTYVAQKFTVTERTAGSRKSNTYIAAPSDSDLASVRAAYTLALAKVDESKWYLSALKGEDVPTDATGDSLTTLLKAQLDLEQAKQTLDSMQIVAPFDGTITTLGISLGDSATTSAVVTVSDNSKAVLDFYLDESDYANVAVGYEVEVTFDAIPNKTFTGKVTEVDPTLSDQNGSKLVHGTAVITDVSDIAKDKLMLGMNASVDVIGGRATKAVLVSVDALHQISDGVYGVFVQENGTLKFKTVEVGIMDTFNAEIKSGLKVGDVVSTGLVESN